MVKNIFRQNSLKNKTVINNFATTSYIKEITMIFDRLLRHMRFKSQLYQLFYTATFYLICIDFLLQTSTVYARGGGGNYYCDRNCQENFWWTLFFGGFVLLGSIAIVDKPGSSDLFIIGFIIAMAAGVGTIAVLFWLWGFMLLNMFIAAGVAYFVFWHVITF